MTWKDFWAYALDDTAGQFAAAMILAAVVATIVLIAITARQSFYGFVEREVRRKVKQELRGAVAVQFTDPVFNGQLLEDWIEGTVWRLKKATDPKSEIPVFIQRPQAQTQPNSFIRRIEREIAKHQSEGPMVPSKGAKS